MFFKALYNLIPDAGYMPLLTEILRDVWNSRQSGLSVKLAHAQQKQEHLGVERQRIIDLLVKGTIDQDVYKEQMARVGTALREVQLEADRLSSEASVNAHDLERLLEFADWLLCRVAGIWKSATLQNKLRVQAALFPDGLTVSNEGFGTASTPLFFYQYAPIPIAANDMASPGGFEPPLSP